ncbi:MAG: MoxR family ATPase [Dehalococcoidia bacterium]|nr:MoxR family ATPase [Dehalococcoidia bacterium]
MATDTGARAIAERIMDNVKKVILGKDEAIRLGVIALMCQGHVLIEDVPGVGKTMLAKSLARSTGCSFSRIQFTPDLLPSDITGVSIFNQKTSEFQFRAGPIIAQVVLADEINRATPKTQSALLEAMEERQVTVEGVTHPLPGPFMVMATQNPIEYEGTFPLPEAQLDRFLLRIRLGYPTFEQEIAIMDSQQLHHPFEDLASVVGPREVLALQEETRKIYVDPLVKQYIATLVEGSRKHRDVALGCSPRASLALQRTGQAMTLLQGRDYVLPDDVKELAEPVMAHRLVLTAAARMQGVDGRRVVQELTDEVVVPGARVGGRLLG